MKRGYNLMKFIDNTIEFGKNKSPYDFDQI